MSEGGGGEPVSDADAHATTGRDRTGRDGSRRDAGNTGSHDESDTGNTSAGDELLAQTLLSVRSAVEAADAVAFVHDGRGVDPDLRALGAPPVDRRCAVVVPADGDATLVVPRSESPEPSPPRRWSGDTADRRVVDYEDPTPGDRVASLLGGQATGGPVLTPRAIPHDTALTVDAAGYDLQSTGALSSGRATKPPAVRAALRSVQRAAARGVRRAASVLDEATAETDGTLHWEGGVLSTERLCRQVNRGLAAEGVDPGGRTVVTTEARDGRRETARSTPITLRAGVPVRVRVEPHDGLGLRTLCRRTLVVDGEGGWERRAHVACEAALRAGLSELAPGTAVDAVEREVAAELGAYGLEAGPGPFVRGVGLTQDDPPRAGEDLQPGSVVAIVASVADPTEGAVELGDVAVVTEGGGEWLVTAPTSMAVGRW